MKPGDVVRGYTILHPFTTTGGGQCMWTFARKDGNEYFFKQFLSPTYPTPDSPGSDKLKAQKRAQCAEFEAHHGRLNTALKKLASGGGNLIVTKEFFRHDSKYYKVTEKVDTTTISLDECAALPMEQRILLLKTVAHSLAILHRQNIVHGDLKPANILIKRTKSGMFAAKLIDFDNSYFQHDPPTNREEVVGDVVYYSPELWRYVTGDPESMSADLTVSSDIFALGVVYTQYLTGKMPDFDTKTYRYAAEAVNAGNALLLPKAGLDRDLVDLISRMLSKSPISRPTIDDVFNTLRNLGKTSTMDREPKGAVPTSDRPALKGSLLKSPVLSTVTAKDIETPTKSALKGSLARRREAE